MLIFSRRLESVNDPESKLGEGRRDPRDTAYVVVAPPKTLDGDLLRRVASVLGKEIIDTRLLLAGEIPRIIASSPDAETADSTAQSLREAGLVAFVCRDSDLRHRPSGFVAHTARLSGKDVIFGNRRGGEVRVGPGDAFLILCGRIQSGTQEKSSTRKMKLNVPATVLTGGIPVMRRVTKTGTKGSFQVEGFLRIFDRRFSDPLVEMFQNHIDYAFLGPELTPSTPVNFKIAVAKLREWFPQAIFDERLAKRFKTDAPSSRPGETLEINCKLIYLCHLAMERRGR
jgi:hypothetical protein